MLEDFLFEEKCHSEMFAEVNMYNLHGKFFMIKDFFCFYY